MKSGLFAFDQATTVGPGTVTNAMLANMAARTVKVNATNAIASPQDLQGTTALTYLRVNASGNGLEWGALPVDPGLVTSVFGRTGAVVATNGDYTASQVTNVPAGNIAAVTVQAALNELDTEKVAKTGDTMTGPLTVRATTTISGPTGTTGRALCDMRGGNTNAGDGAVTYYVNNGASVGAIGNNSAIFFSAYNAQFTYFSVNGHDFLNNVGTQIAKLYDSGGMTVGAATGGSQGPGTLNATGLYENGTALTAKYARLASANTFTQPQTIANNLNVNDGTTTGALITLGTNLNGIIQSTGGSLTLNGAGYAVTASGVWTFPNATTFSSTVKVGVFTVGTLPSAAGIDGAKAHVTDALAPAFGATVASGGAVHVPVYSDNAVWKVG